MTNTKDKPPREWWISDAGTSPIVAGLAYVFDKKPVNTKTVHVVEFSALKAAAHAHAKQLSKLEDELTSETVRHIGLLTEVNEMKQDRKQLTAARELIAEMSGALKYLINTYPFIFTSTGIIKANGVLTKHAEWLQAQEGNRGK